MVLFGVRPTKPETRRVALATPEPKKLW